MQTVATAGSPSANCKAAAGSVTRWASHTSAVVVTRPSSSGRSDPGAPNRTKLGIVVYLSWLASRDSDHRNSSTISLHGYTVVSMVMIRYEFFVSYTLHWVLRLCNDVDHHWENTGHTVPELAGLTAVVTGAGFGIGLATAENFTAADARVLRFDITAGTSGDLATWIPYDRGSTASVAAVTTPTALSASRRGFRIRMRISSWLSITAISSRSNIFRFARRFRVCLATMVGSGPRADRFPRGTLTSFSPRIPRVVLANMVGGDDHEAVDLIHGL